MSQSLAPDHRGPFQVQVADHDEFGSRRAKQSCRGNPQLKSSDACAREQTFGPVASSVDLTGRWEDDRGRFNLFLNHVGRHLEGMLVLVSHGRSPRVEEFKDGTYTDRRPGAQCLRLFGDENEGAPGVFMITKRDEHGESVSAHPIGMLTPSGESMTLLWTDAGESEALLALSGATMTRINRSPSLFERYLGPPPAPQVPLILRTSHWFPLTRKQAALLRTLVLTRPGRLALEDGEREATLPEMIEAFLALPRDLEGIELRARRQVVVENMDDLVGDVFSWAQGAPVASGGIHQSQQVFHRALALSALAETKISYRDTERSLLTLLYEVLRVVPNEERLRYIPRWLGLESQYGFVYDAALDIRRVPLSKAGYADEIRRYLKRVSVSGAYYEGTLTLTERGEDGWGPAVFNIGLVAAGASWGRGLTSTISTTGESRPTSRRLPEDLEGFCIMTDGGVSAAAGAGKSAGGTVLTLNISHGMQGQGLGLNFSGLSDITGFTASLGLTFFIGWVELRGRGSSGGDVVPKWTLPKASYRHPVKTLEQNHYSINNALLMPAGMRCLEEFAATELVALSDPQTQVLVEGYADRSGTETFNKKLSEKRASNAMRYLERLLAAPRASIKSMGRGETPGAGKDGTDNVLYRRVDVSMDTEVVMSLKGM